MSSLERLTVEPGQALPPPASLRGRRYGEDRIHLLVRDPRSVLVVWELAPGTSERAGALAAVRGMPALYVLRLERRERADQRAAVQRDLDLPDALGGEGWYVELPLAGGELRATIGLRLREEFHPLLESRWTPVPPDGPCLEEGEWDLTPEAEAWLRARLAAAGAAAPGSGMPSMARFIPHAPSGTGR